MLKEYEFKDRVMGTNFIVSLVSGSEESARGGYSQALGIAKAYEKRFSRFLDDSELSTLNKEKDLIVSEMFWQVFLVAENLYRETNRVFNPLLQIESMGYVSDFSKMDKNIEKAGDVCYDVDWNNLSSEYKTRRICLNQNQKLDFGGFLKGYVAEDIGNILKYDFPGIIINIGGDIFTFGDDENQKPFTFSVFNPFTQKDFGHVLVKNEAVATSGIYKRKWKVSEKEVFHILDTNKLDNPETDLVSATVIAPHGHIAEAYATVAICLGQREAIKLLDRKHFRYILINKDGQVFKNT